MYSINNTVYSTSNDNPLAKNADGWIGIVREVVRRAGYWCETIRSARVAKGTMVMIRESDVTRYRLCENDLVKYVNRLDEEHNGKMAKVAGRSGSGALVYLKFVDDGYEMANVDTSLCVLVESAMPYDTHDLSVGMRVKLVNGIDDFFGLGSIKVAAGTLGTVRSIAGDSYGVEIDGCTTAHDLNGVLSTNAGWYFYRNEIAPLEDAHTVEHVKTNETEFKLGDILVHKGVKRLQEIWAGEVVEIDGKTVTLKTLKCQRMYISARGALTADEYSTNDYFGSYVEDSADNLVLAIRDGVIVPHDYKTGEKLTDDDRRLSCTDGAISIENGADTHTLQVYIAKENLDNVGYRCERCGEIHLNDFSDPIKVRNSDGGYDRLCPHCADRYCTRCEHCGTYYYDGDDFEHVMYGEDEDGDYECWCPTCVERDAHWCDDCEHYYMGDRCPTCAIRGRINNYSYKPDPLFLKMPGEETKLYYGIEDETEGRGSEPENFAFDLRDVTEVYCKHDGSLSNGAEVVTHPCTLRYHLESGFWEKVAEIARAHNMKSHDTTTCGLHVHISRNAFDGVEDYEEKMTLAFDRFKAYWKVISRRKNGDCSHWAGFLSDKRREKTNTKISEVKNKKDRYDRYQAVNLCNDHTIEIRIFRGTLKVSTIKATLWLLDATCNFIINGGNVETCTFAELVNLANAPDFVKDYLRAREIPIV